MDKEEELRSNLLKLYDQRKIKEQSIIQQYEILKKENVGMNDPLVDKEGFPRSDIDIYAVRAARNQIICLQNDCRALTKEIEENLHRYHQLTGQMQPQPPFR